VVRTVVAADRGDRLQPAMLKAMNKAMWSAKAERSF